MPHQLVHTVLAAGSGAAPSSDSGFFNGAAINGLVVFVIGLVLSVITVVALWQHGKKGDVRQSSNVSLASIIACIPFALAMTGIWYGISTGALDFLVKKGG